MDNFKEEIAKIIGQILDGLTEDEIKDMVEVPQDDKMGDYAFPLLKLAKTLRKAPPLIAADIAAKIEATLCLKRWSRSTPMSTCSSLRKNLSETW